MLQDFQNIVNLSLTPGEVVGNLFVALICGLLVSFFYRITYKGPGYTSSYLNSLVALSMITAVVIMVIGNNLARAFGLVGAMSIIRFRTAVKETLDIIFIFFALAIGMAAGVGLTWISIIGTFFIGTTLYVLSKTNIIAPPREEFLLQFTIETNGTEAEPEYMHIVNEYCKKKKLMNVKSVGPEILEMSYYVNLKNKKLNNEFVNKLRRVKGIKNINLYFDEETL